MDGRLCDIEEFIKITQFIEEGKIIQIKDFLLQIEFNIFFSNITRGEWKLTA